MIALFLALASVVDAGRKPPVRALEFDLIEINHRYDQFGRHCYDQVLFLDWSPNYRRYDVEAWVLMNEHGPMIERDSEGWIVTAYQSGMRIKARAKSKVESWTNNDPEMDNRKLKPESTRRGFRVLSR